MDFLCTKPLFAHQPILGKHFPFQRQLDLCANTRTTGMQPTILSLNPFLGGFSLSVGQFLFSMHISPQNILFFSLKKRIYEEIVGENDGRKLFMELAQVAASAARIEPR